VTAFVVAVASVGFLSGILIRDVERDFLLESLTKQSQKTFALLSATSIDAVVTEDLPLLETIVVQSVKNDSEIFSLIIENEEGAILAQWKNTEVQPSNLPLSFSEPLVLEGETFGKVTLAWNVDPAYLKIQSHVLRIRLYLTGILVSLTILIVFLLHWLVIRPVRKINQRLATIAKGDYTSGLRVSASRELVHLADSVIMLADTLKVQGQQEEELRQRAARIRAIVNTAVDGIMTVDEQGMIETFNPAAEQIFGYTNVEIIGQNANILLSTPYSGEHDDYLQNYLKNGEKNTIGNEREALGQRQDETIFPMEVSISELVLDGHRLLTWIVRDISDRKKAEADLHENRQRLELAIQAMDAGLWDWDIPSGKMIVNDRWTSMLGYDPGEEGDHISSWEKILHPQDLLSSRKILDEHLAGASQIYQNTFRLRMKTGEWMWIQSTGKLVSKDSNGNPQRVIGTHIDIDKRKQNEIELAHYRLQLEDMVEERTRELKAAQDQLINQAIESGRAQLSAMILHNIGNAITPVSVQVEELMRDKQGAQISNYLKRSYQDLSENIDRLTEYVGEDKRGQEVFGFLGKLIDSLAEQRNGWQVSLDKISEAISYVSEIISLQQNYAAGARENLELTDLNRLIDDALKMQSTALEKREIRIEKDLGPNLSQLTIDKNKLMQVVVNLIKNSYEAIDELNGEDREHFISFKTFNHDDQIGFEISDSGVGVAPENIENILQFGESFKGSSGVGLYYCKMFLEANQGKFDFFSDGSGKGATVRLLFNANSE